MTAALVAVSSGGITQYKAAEHYKIFKKTLNDQVLQKSSRRMGRLTSLQKKKKYCGSMGIWYGQE